MAMAAHSPEFAKKVGIAVSVAKEFVQADEHKKKLTEAMRSKKRGH